MSLVQPIAEGVDVTDHAVIRWLERVCGYDIAQVRAEIRAAFMAGCPALRCRPGDEAKVFVDVPAHRVHLLGRDGEVITVFCYEGEPD